MIHCPCGYIVNFSRTSQIHAVEKYAIQTSGAKTPRNCPFPWRHVDCHQTHPFLVRSHSPPQTTARSIHTFLHNYATKFPLVTMGSHKFTAKTAPFSLTITTPSNTTQMAPGSTQPFCHNTLQADRQPTDPLTDRPTDGLGEEAVPIPAYDLSDSDAAKVVLCCACY